MATPTAHTEQHGGHKGIFPPFNSATFASQLVWLVLTFVVLYVLMSRLALPRVGAIIERREKQIAHDFEAAEELKKQSEEAIAAYEKALADARNRAQAIANETREKQAAAAEQDRKVLEDKLNVRLADAEKTINATKSAAMTNVGQIATETAKAIVERLIGTAPSDATVTAAVADVLKR